MNFAWYFSTKIAFAKSNKKNLSHYIIRIGQIAVTIGIVVSLLTLSVGVGSGKAIKSKLYDFNGHITIDSYDANNSFNSNPVNLQEFKFKKAIEGQPIQHYQYIANRSGVIRTATSFEGVVLKGVSENYDASIFDEFLVKGRMPIFSPDSLSFEVIVSEKIAQELHLDIDSTFLMYFIRQDKKPLYRRFTLVGMYKTDIRNIDDVFILGDIKQVQRINNWENYEVGGIEIFLDNIDEIDPVYQGIYESPALPLDLQVKRATDTYSIIKQWIDLFDINIVVVVSLMMLVVAINMVMILLILIIERTPSIGLLKTIGTSNITLQFIFIYYTVLIMIPGLVIGNILSLLIMLIQKYFKVIPLDPDSYYIDAIPMDISWTYFVGISAISLIIAFVTLLLPSLLISRITPIRAIRFK